VSRYDIKTRYRDPMIRDFFLGFIKIHILHHAAQEPVYGLALIAELQRHGYAVGAGTLYPVLHGLTEARYLARRDRVVGGRVRKYYAITPAGLRALATARTQIAELVEELLEERGPARLQASRRRQKGRARPGRRTSAVRRPRAGAARR